MDFYIGIFFILLLISLLIFADQVAKIAWDFKNFKKSNKTSTIQISSIVEHASGYAYLLMAIVIIGGTSLLYFYLQGTVYEGHLKEWMNLIVRWVHITFGIAWIGASFYFVFLENSLNRVKGLRDEIAGDLWAVHGGGFYYIEKYKVSPKVIPEDLHWFKYEAYFTWLSGMILLSVVYYLNAKTFLIDPEVMDITPIQSIVISVYLLTAGWMIYDFMCKTPLLKKGLWFAIIGFFVITIFAYIFTHIFNSRAAFIHVGALLGTCMAGNVFFGIIPAQKAMVNAAKAGKIVDPTLGEIAGLRSFHNNYMTLPVLFIMISNHFPSTFGHEYNWAILAAISLSSAIFKHFLNIIEKGKYATWFLPVSIIMMVSIAFISAPDVNSDNCDSKIQMTQVYNIIQERCATCHSSKPTDKVWTAPPNGVKYDTPQEIQKMSEKIMQRVVITKTMPQNNQTGMTLEERELIGCWIMQGANIE